jgi:uracil-DNA glycosylase
MNHGSGPVPARIMVIGEYYSQDDFHSQEAFSGQAGIEFNRMLHEAGIMRSECFLTNIVNGRPNNGLASDWIPKKKKDIRHGYHVQHNGVWLAKTVLEGWAQVQKEIEAVRPNVIIACGELSLFLLTGASGPLKWRGSLLQAHNLPDQTPPKVIPIISPASIFSMWEYRSVTVSDLKRAAAHKISREMPKNNWNFLVRPSYDAVTRTINSLITRAENETEPLWLDFDLETRAGHIACAGVSWTLDDCISIPFMCVEDIYGFWGPDGETEIVFLLYTLLTHPNVRVRGQNLLYDCQYTWRWWKFLPRVAQDTMISHHTLFAALPKSLAFQASMYCEDYKYWKDDGATWRTGGGVA